MVNTFFLHQLKRVVRECISHNHTLDMSTFGRGGLTQHECGTVHCLGGYAALDKFFQEQGLALAIPAGNRYGALTLKRTHNNVPHVLENFEALKKLFELDETQCDYLFGDNPQASGVSTCRDFYEALVRVQEVIDGEV